MDIVTQPLGFRRSTRKKLRRCEHHAHHIYFIRATGRIEAGAVVVFDGFDRDGFAIARATNDRREIAEHVGRMGVSACAIDKGNYGIITTRGIADGVGAIGSIPA